MAVPAPYEYCAWHYERVSRPPLWLQECPWDDQGVIGLLVAEGRLVLMCDDCGTVWCTKHDLDDGRFSQPASPEWRSACGVAVAPGTTRWATRGDLASHADWLAMHWNE